MSSTVDVAADEVAKWDVPHFHRTRSMLLHGVRAGASLRVEFEESGTIAYWQTSQTDGYDRTYQLKLNFGSEVGAQNEHSLCVELAYRCFVP